ncbi:hypothetical protein C8035_v001280 [Colletotrichum spinosum]|uniref:NB-ARC domain-containing protein n=1 Tax=Colletotrichum spinosum TaxID=1347390 RepID=A0A4R8QCX0_9PEZI|nr:hypothetical protein C8035_v001280 [Colletotrichum spinosum]
MLLQKALERTGGCRTAVLYGLGGMGKTQLAIAYVKEHRDDYSAFNSRDYLNKRNGQMAEERHLKSGQIPPETAGSTPYDIRAYLPETDHGAIIITTRSSMVKLGQSIRLKKLGDINDSLAILGSTSDRHDIRQGESINVD